MALNNITEWTGLLVTRVLDKRPLPPPAISTTNRARTIETTTTEATHGLTHHTDTRLALAALRLHHARWLSSYPGVGVTLLEGARAVMVQAYRALDAQPMRRITLRATCGFIIESNEYGEIACEGTLYGLVAVDEDPRPTSIVCAANPEHRIDKPSDKLWLDIL